MAAAMQEFHPVLKRGDAFLHNSPYHGCSHPADHTILVPVMDDQGRHRFTMVAKAHQADCGNSLATTYMGGARDVYQEGALIFPAVRVQENYQDIEDIVRMCRMRIRVPEQWWGDYLAEMGAARIGERELMALAAEVGWDTLDTFTDQWFEYSEQRMSAAIARLPAGKMTVSSAHDPFPGAEDGIEVKVQLTIDPADAMIEVDLRDNPDCLPCGLNLSEACSRTSAMVGVFNSIDHTVPPNAGSFRRIRVLLRENCVVGIPRHPTSCSVATTNVADHVSNGVQRAIAELAEGAGMAEVGYAIPPAIGVISGLKPDSGEPFVNQIFLGFGAGAASPSADAWVTVGHVGNAGLCYQDSAEVDEQVFPISSRAAISSQIQVVLGAIAAAAACRSNSARKAATSKSAMSATAPSMPPKARAGAAPVGGRNNMCDAAMARVKPSTLVPKCPSAKVKSSSQYLAAAAVSARRLRAQPPMWPTTRAKDGSVTRRRSTYMASFSAPTAKPIWRPAKSSAQKCPRQLPSCRRLREGETGACSNSIPPSPARIAAARQNKPCRPTPACFSSIARLAANSSNRWPGIVVFFVPMAT